MKIILDVFGCDKGPEEILKGVKDAMDDNAGLLPVLAGSKEIMTPILESLKIDMGRVEIIDAPEVITNDDVPTTALRSKKNSSLVRAATELKSRDDIAAMISAGNTGAVLVAGSVILGQIGGGRPALAPLMPTLTGGQVCLIDSGANVDAGADRLVQFALMGSAYMNAVCGIEKPRVALVANGTEDKKGNAVTQEAFKLLKELPINFVGNMEARDIFTGNFDVLVCDGFAGNILLKTMEGTIKMILTKLKTHIKSSASAKFGYLFMKKAFGNLKNEIDYNAMGGAPLLGVNKIVVKCHGSSDAVTIRGAFKQAALMAKHDLIANLKAGLTLNINAGGAEN